MAVLAAAATFAGALPATALACSAKAPRDRSVPTFKHVTGLTLGSRAASPAQIDAYVRAVDEASPRVRGFLAGRSIQGRPIRYAAVGTPGHVAPGRLEALGALMRGVRAGKYPSARVAQIARTRPAFVWIGGSVHGNEPSGGDADMQLLYDLASGRTCADQHRLRSLVVFFLPLQNPDGRAASARVNDNGFDLNRDWFARTQAETAVKIEALTRFPPTVFADQHEEGGTGFFFPPNADPIHHEISAQALHAINRIVAPRLRRAFGARHIDFTNYATYDMFFMGYGDSVPSTLFGAAGMTFEKGANSPYPEKTAEAFLAADQTLRAAAAHKRELLSAWGEQWLQAAAQGERGALQPNRVVQPHNTVRFEVPAQQVYGFTFRGDVHGADAAALAHRLVTVGVSVLRLAQDVPVSALRGYGEAASVPATLPAGSYYVPMAQAAKHWVEALLGEDPYVPFPYFYDVSSWSNPLLMGLSGGALHAPVTVPPGAATEVAAGDTPAAPVSDAPGYGFGAGAQGSVELVFDLLRAGLPVARAAGGGFTVTGGGAKAIAAAAAHRVALTALAAPPAGATALALPKVARLQDVSVDTTSGWTAFLLNDRYHLRAPILTGADLAAGKLAGYTVLVVPDGVSDPSQLSVAALSALRAWVSAGGTLIGWRSRGLGVAQAAGVTAVTAAGPPASVVVPGVALRVALSTDDPVAWGEEAEGFAFSNGDQVFTAHGAPVVARYPAGSRFFVSGYASGADALKGSPAATDERVGAGRVVLFSFDPVFRGYVEGTERLVGNALLAPRAAGAGARSAPRAVSPAALGVIASPYRDAIVQVAAEDEAALLAAAREAGVPDGFAVDRDLTTVTLRVPNPRGLDVEERPWTRTLPSALAARGVRPLLAAF